MPAPRDLVFRVSDAIATKQETLQIRVLVGSFPNMLCWTALNLTEDYMKMRRAVVRVIVVVVCVGVVACWLDEKVVSGPQGSDHTPGLADQSET